MLNFRLRLTALALAAALSSMAHAASLTKTFTLANSGNGPLTISGAKISGNTAEYVLSGNGCGSPVAAGNSCALTVTFTPAGSGTRPAASLVYSSNGTNGPSHSISLTGAGAASCTAGKQVFGYTGGDQNIAVPSGCSTAVIKAWGAAGRTGNWAYCAGGGGFAQRTVTGLAPGAPLTVVVGQGGIGSGATYGGGGSAGASSGAGGGYSGVFSSSVAQTNALVVAGGGGGAALAYGGAGGGSSGSAGAGVSSFTSGMGGTQIAGGAGGGGLDAVGATGAALRGGNGAGSYPTGGGGGYWGGGGGNWSGAGGGSGYAPGGTLISASSWKAANPSDGDYAAGVGNAGCATYVSGQNGRVVITWQ